jgi:ribosome biogenesis protein Nip4
MIMKCEAGTFELTGEMKRVIDRMGVPFAAGILKKKKNPSLQEMMLKDLGIPKVFVKSKAEQLFLYGRDILESSILKGQKNSGLVLVCNEQGDKLGFGMFQDKVIKNLADIGLYLRKE